MGVVPPQRTQRLLGKILCDLSLTMGRSPIRGAPTPTTTTGWISSTHWSRQEHADCHRQRLGGVAGAAARHRTVGHHARSLSDGILREKPGRPIRRCEWRMEGKGHLVNSCDPNAVASGRRQRHDEQGGEVPAPPRPAREVSRLRASTLEPPVLSAWGWGSTRPNKRVRENAQNATRNPSCTTRLDDGGRLGTPTRGAAGHLRWKTCSGRTSGP
jgi:hypothetical protein